MINKTFTYKDQEYFASLSGDYNPIHLDRVYARRSLFGAIVVHGIHQIVCGLELWLSNTNSYYKFKSIDAMFIEPVKLNQKIFYKFIQNQYVVEIQILNEVNSVVSKIEYEYEDWSGRQKCGIQNRSPKKERAVKNLINDLFGYADTIDLMLNLEELETKYPHLRSKLPNSQLAFLLSATRIVGMYCPGENSIFNSLNIQFTADKKDYNIKYKVKKIHKRLNIVSICTYSNFAIGAIKAVIRPPMVTQPSAAALSQLVRPDEFKGQRALIIGGSRGIGETTLKLLAVGGADVTFTYFTGALEADVIVHELKQIGVKVTCFQMDALNGRDIAIKLKGTQLNSLYYFPTPHIFSGSKGVFQKIQFQKFCDYYLFPLVSIVENGVKNGLKKVFYPSTTSINELVNGMWEYSVAKMAGELLCEILEKQYNPLLIYKPRLPRVSTDQTKSVIPVNNEATETVMVEQLRKFSAL